MNSETYAAIYEEETLVETGQEAFTSFIASTLTDPGENEIVPPIFNDAEKIGNVLQPYVTGEWVKEQLMSVTQQLLQFLNFQTPFGIVDVNLSGVGRVPVINTPFKFSETATGPAGPPPSLGQDNHAVLRDIAGFTESEIEEMEKEGIIKGEKG